MWSLMNRPKSSTATLAGGAVIVLAFLWFLVTLQGAYHGDISESSNLWHQVSKYLPSKDPGLYRTNNIMLIMKTGATVIDSRLPVHVNTTLPPAKNLLIFSSRNQTFEGYPVRDILYNVSSSMREKHEDFEVYRKLQELEGTEDSDAQIADLASGKAWNLDKYKFMPMVFEAYKLAPKEVEWFVMIEADTSLSWTNMVWWLNGLDHRKPRYMGAPNYCVGDPCSGQLFAHGGSGIFWSRAAVAKMAEIRQTESPELYDRRWEKVTEATCCGDIVLAEAFQEAGVNLTHANPMVQGATLETFVWHGRDWCRPPITWHHVEPDEIEEIHQFSENWAKAHRQGVPYFYSDVYEELVAGQIRKERKFWDNKSRSPVEGVETKEDCFEGCKQHKSCVQWMWTEHDKDSKCRFGDQITIGEEFEEKEGREIEGHVISGWIQEKVNQTIADFGPC